LRSWDYLRLLVLASIWVFRSRRLPMGFWPWSATCGRMPTG